MSTELDKDLLGYLGDWRWRINNLYQIVDDTGQQVKFVMNTAQEALVADMHYLNLILKARQLGFTTFIQLFMLDACIFNSNVRAGTIAHTIDDAKIIFRDKVKFPYDRLPDAIRAAVPIKQDNLTELLLGNNSSLRVGVSLRSGTLNYLHISEYGKICSKYPEKAREVRTGSLNTISAGQFAFIESTAEGREGHFFDMCEDARAKLRRGDQLSALDFKFTFWPWWGEPEYRLPVTGPLNEPLQRYFNELESVHGIKTDPEQRAWYAKKAETQLADMKREFPSTPDEAFEASLEGAYYGDLMAKTEFENRVAEFPIIKHLPVHTAWDIGMKDYTSIWFFQVFRGKILLVAYYQNSGEYAAFYIKKLIEYGQRLGFRYGKHFFPPDAKVREWGGGRTRLEQLIDYNLKNIRIVTKHNLDDGINAVRDIIPDCYFNKSECAEGIRAVKSYRKDWNEEMGCWKSTPRHDWASHGADAFRYLAMGYRQVEVLEPNDVKLPAPRLKLPANDIRQVTMNQLWKDHDGRRKPEQGMI